MRRRLPIINILYIRLEVDYFQDWMADEEETVKGITLFVGK